jgi:hypothetical protein
VNINEPRRHDVALSIKDPIGTIRIDLADLDDPTVMNRDVVPISRRACSIDNHPILDDNVEVTHNCFRPICSRSGNPNVRSADDPSNGCMRAGRSVAAPMFHCGVPRAAVPD